MRKAILLSATLLAACSNYSTNLPSIKPYKMDVQQGNVVTPKMMMQLRPGMSKAQVRFVMGTPLITDSFHANRWDYFYRMQKDGKVIEQRRVILDFEDEKLLRVRGDVVPAGSGATEPSSGDRPAGKAPVTLKSTSDAPKKEEKGMLDKLKFWKSDEPEKAAKPVEVQKALTKPAEAQPPVNDQLPAVAEKKAEALPPLMEEEPAVAPAESRPATKPQASPTAQPVAKPEPAKQPEPKPAIKTAPAPEPRKVEVNPETKPEPPKPVAKPLPKAEPKAAPKPQDDLPAEDDPSYFERMLEKIGF